MFETFFLWFFGLLAMLFAIGLIMQKHPMRAALSLIGVMISLAAIYGILQVHVVAVFQVLVYVGAVMVFMIYVIMMLDDKDMAFIQKYSKLLVPGVVVFFVFLVAMIGALSRASVIFKPLESNSKIFTFEVFSEKFITHYLFHFELASLLLLVGVIAAVTVIKGGRHG
ncbi:NADH-quinone oxidoreductase subunit J [Deltaproteobacteria bacterium TL4]